MFTPSVSSLKRLQNELMDVMMNGGRVVQAFPIEKNMYHWKATLVCNEDSVYSGIKFEMDVLFEDDYPYKAPKVTFKTSVFHPNVDQKGNICLDILKDKWSPVYNVRTLLISIQQLLDEPNEDDPLCIEAAQAWNEGIDYFKQQALGYHKKKNSEMSGMEH